MSDSSGLAPPGSSSYDSNTMHVGDGTWDATRDTFLLPNLVGFNFATMRYNGMGNRFFTMTGYQSLIRAHGIIAAVTFLGLIPAAIFLMRFYGRRPAWALRLHIWLQILTLILSTVVLILGWFAVGPSRALSNPHHGIGLAIYVLIWAQVIGGWLVHRSEKKKRHYHIPLKAMLHHWLGRMIALLGIAQVALGLTVYGSPLFLFILYAVFVFALVVVYFILEWLHERRKSEVGSHHGSYTVEEIEVNKNRKSGRFGQLATAGVAGAGLGAWWKHRSNKRRASESDITGTGSLTSYEYDEKDSDTSNRGWGRRIVQIGAIGGGLATAKKLFGRKKQTDDQSSVEGPYRPPLGGNQSVVTDSMSRIEEGRPPPRPVTPTGNSPGYVRPSHPLAQPPMTPGSGRRQSNSEYSYYSFESSSPSRRGRHQTFRQALTAGGTMFAVRSLFKNRRQQKEERRTEDLRNQRIEEERIARMNSAHRYTGDGVTPPRRPRQNRVTSQSASDVSSYMDGSVQRPGISSTTVPVAGVEAAAAGALADRNRVRPVGTDPVIAPPGPASAVVTDVPPMPPPHGTDMNSSGSEMYTTASGRQRYRHRTRDEAAAAVLAGGALGAAGAQAGRRRASGRQTDSMESPPVSVHVKTHDHGRKVTLRRLTQEEAEAERAAKSRASASRRRRNSSLSSSSGGEALGRGTSAERRWRRTEALEAQQAAENEAAARRQGGIPTYPTPPLPGTQQGVDPQTGHPYMVPPPPPIPASTSNLGPAGSITSPGTETSGATEYANNRRRRRAERAQARLAKDGRTGGGNTVDFT